MDVAGSIGLRTQRCLMRRTREQDPHWSPGKRKQLLGEEQSVGKAGGSSDGKVNRGALCSRQTRGPCEIKKKRVLE